MVLQDADRAAPDSFTDNPYPSENDPYASEPTTGIRFDPTNFPQPLPVLGSAMGYTASAIRFKVETTMKFAERRVGRPLTSEESQALAYHLYQLEQTTSYFAVAGGALGTLRWYTTWEKMRYPFYQPKQEAINRDKFLMVRGPMAQAARHTWRFALYALVAGGMGNIIGAMIAQPLAAVNSSKDPKLEQFGADLKASAPQAHDQRRGQQDDAQRKRREFQEQVRNRTGGGPSPQARWGKQAPVKSEEDDSSPTAGNEAWDSANLTGDSWESSPNSTSQSVPQQQQTYPSPADGNRRSPPRQPESPAPLPFDDDDSSPTGGLFQDEVKSSKSNPQQPSRPGESTWDRLRRGGAPAPLQRPPHHQSRRAEPQRREQNDSSGESIGDYDEERKKERDRAQQEFDARLERERQGRDFSSDEGKRW